MFQKLIYQADKAMKINKLGRFKADGWKVGNTDDYLQLSDEEARFTGNLMKARHAARSCPPPSVANPDFISTLFNILIVYN